MNDFKLARISSVHRGSFSIIGEFGEVRAEITGRLANNAENSLDFPAVGDWVNVNYLDGNTFAIIDNINPRTSLLKRKTVGQQTEYQIIAANIDVAFIIQSLDANFNINRLERYLVMINEARIKPVILLSKKDLVPVSEVGGMIQKIKDGLNNIEVIPFSNKTKEGFNQIESLLVTDKTYCLLGSSGVGKSTLLNSLLGEAVFDTQEVREKDSRGKHTTSRRQLISLKNGAFIIDTPGMRELGNIDVDNGLKLTFDEIEIIGRNCRFSDCTHTHETGCAVLDAVAIGKLSKTRYMNFIKLRKENDFNKMTYLDKRRKDKDFGKMVKQVMKGKNKKGL
ncbi:ribosome small subunit-dependent GTPase A [Thermoproteota archaeon]